MSDEPRKRKIRVTVEIEVSELAAALRDDCDIFRDEDDDAEEYADDLHDDLHDDSLRESVDVFFSSPSEYEDQSDMWAGSCLMLWYSNFDVKSVEILPEGAPA